MKRVSRSLKSLRSVLASRYRRLPKIVRFGGFTLSLLLIMGVSYLVFSLLYIGKVYPRVTLSGHQFAGLEEAEVKEKLTRLNESIQTTPLVLTHINKKIELRPVDVDYQVNIEQTARSIINVGRSGLWLQDLSDQIIGANLVPIVTFDSELLAARLDEFFQQIDQPAVQAAASFDGAKLVVQSEKEGLVVDRDQFRRAVLDSWASFNPRTIEAVMARQSPTVRLGDRAILEQQVQSLLETRLTLEWDFGRRTLSPADLRAMIAFGPPAPSNADGEITELAASFTLASVSKFLLNHRAAIDRPAVNPKLVIENGALRVAERAKTGLALNVEPSAEAILAAIAAASPTARLALKEQQPLIDENRLDTLGIRERIGHGETDFTGSSINRRINIVNGVNILQSALIAPNQEFSTVKALGVIDASTGFLPELVIKDNRTIPEYGGGLCQVSTTLFRAALNAGLPITERQNHSYRVHYYEPPIGLDATIYLPRPDFKFKNNTPGHILVQGRVVGNRVIFEFWGTSDGRTTHLSEPVISNPRPAGPPIFDRTDTLFEGEQRQIEFPRDGLTAVIHYTVNRDGQVIHRQTFRSVYRAWPARFLIGTRPRPAPSP